jgi:hypothetical protein
MKFYILTFLLLTSISSFSQKEFERKKLDDKYSWDNSTRDERNEFYFGLNPVASSKFEYHLRYEISDQIVDLYSENGIEFKGQLVNFVQENKRVKICNEKSLREYNYLFEKKAINNSVASKVGLLILNQKMYLKPKDSLIQNWNFLKIDYGTIDLDCKIKSDFYKKSYSGLQNQEDSIGYVIELRQLKDSIGEILRLKESYENFENRWPKGKCYTIDRWISICVATKKQRKRWVKNKPIRDYQESIKDTIDNYLECELNRIIQNSNELDCFDDYRLIFSKNGILKRMEVSMGFWERLFDKDYRKCRRVLGNAFREIKIDFVDPKYEFYRRLIFEQKRIYIFDFH